MQTVIKRIQEDRPDVPIETISIWASYLSQLTTCRFYSAASPDIDKEAWLRQRTAGIGGSEIAGLLGENKWLSPRQIWLSKLNMFDEMGDEQSEPARWGNLLEAIVAEEWGRRNNRKWIHIPVILQSIEYPWMLANIDGFTLSDDGKIITGILEVKTTSEYNRDYWENGPLPYNYICQANWYCGITGLGSFDLVCLVGGQRLFSESFPFDPDLFQREVDVAKAFWEDHVLKGIEPEIAAEDLEDVKQQEYDIDLPPRYLEDDESERIAEAYCVLREKISGMEKLRKVLQAQLYEMLGNGTQALTQTRTLTLQTSARRTCDFDALLEQHPDIYTKFVSAKPFVSLRVK